MIDKNEFFSALVEQDAYKVLNCLYELKICGPSYYATYDYYQYEISGCQDMIGDYIYKRINNHSLLSYVYFHYPNSYEKLEIIKELAQFFNLNDAEHQAIVYSAVVNKNLDLLEMLCQHGVDFNFPMAANGISPCATVFANSSEAEFRNIFMEKFINVFDFSSYKNQNGSNASTQLIKEILENPNDSTLHIANLELLEKIINRIDTNIEDSCGEKPIFLLKEITNHSLRLELFRLFVKPLNLNTEDNMGNNIAYYISLEGDEDLLMELDKEGIDWNHKNNHNVSAYDILHQYHPELEEKLWGPYVEPDLDNDNNDYLYNLDYIFF